MAQIETWLKTDLQQVVKVQELDGNLFTADNGANRIGVIVTNKGESVSLSGGVTGYIIRPDEATVVVNGSLSGNRAWVDLPASVYVKTGPFSVVLKNGNTTIGAACGFIRRSITDTIVDPGHIVPSLAELLAQIEAMHQLSQTVTQQESGRVTAESGRVAAESERASAESARATAEVNRGNAETGRANAETARVNAESARANAETARGNAETARAAAETARENAETARVAAETTRANAESARDDAETVRANAETARGAAETARVNAESARVGAEASRVSAESQRETDFAAAKAAAEAATTSANTAASKINNMTVAASGLPAGSSPTVAISEVDGHKHIVFGLVKGDPGKDFEIRKTFASIAQMEAYDPDTDPSDRKVRVNDFVMIDTGSVQDVDTGKLFCYEPDTIDVWRYIGDLSGSQGIKGETGTGIANITLNPDYTLTITMDDGTTSYTTGSIRGAQGPQGVQGDPGADGSDGADGFSPTVTVTAITGGHRVSVTDVTTTHTFDVFDGINGTDGADGADGADGVDGVDGTSAYLHIRYSHTQPTQDSDMGATPDDWMGIYSGTSSTPPTAYTDYAWYKIKGETGSVQNIYATTIPMSDQDSTKISAAIAAKMDALNAAAPYDNTATYAEGAYCFHDGLKKCTTAITTAEEWTAAHWTSTTIAAELQGKVDANQGAGNAGKALGIDNQGYVVPVPFSGEDFRGATDQAAGTHGYVPAPAAGDQGKFLKGDGSWGTVPNPQNMGGATAQAAGTAGLAPAPAAGDQNKFLKGNGTWGEGLSPNDIANDLTTETAGKVLDARQGKVLKDAVDAMVTSTLRTIPFSIPVASWALSGGYYTATVVSAFITASSKELVTYDGSLRTAFKGDMNVEKTNGGGSLTFTTNRLPVGPVNGTIYCVDSNDGKIAVVLQDTVMPIANGGTGAQTAAGARTNLGAAAQTDMTAAQDDIADLSTELAAVESGLAYRETGATASRNISDGEYVFWNGAMYTANGDIASGVTLVPGTNLTPTENALSALNSKSTWVSGTYTTGDMKFAEYPTGYSYDNCYITGGYVIANTNEKYFAPNTGISTYLKPNGIYGYTNTDTFRNKTYYVELTLF